MDTDISFSHLFVQYVHGNNEQYKKMLQLDSVNNSCTAVMVNQLVDAIHTNKNPDWLDMINKFSSYLTSNVYILPKAQTKARLNDLVIYYNITVIYRILGWYETALTLISFVIANLTDAEYPIHLCFSLLQCEVLLDQYFELGQTPDWLQKYLVPILNDINVSLTKKTYPKAIKEVLSYKYYLISSIQTTIMTIVKSSKKNIKSVSQISFHSIDEYINAIIPEIEKEYHTNSISPIFFTLTQNTDKNAFFVNAQYLKSYLVFNRGHYKKIIASCSDETTDILRLSLLGSCHYALNNISTAIYYYNLILQLNPLNDHVLLGSVYKNLGIMYMDVNNMKLSYECFQQSIRYLPYNASIWYLLSSCLQKRIKQSSEKKKHVFMKEMKAALQTALQLTMDNDLHINIMLKKMWVELELHEYNEVCIDYDLLDHLLSSQSTNNINNRQLMVLYKSEALYNLNENEEALLLLSPLQEKTLYPSSITKAVEDASLEDVVDIREKEKNSYCECMLYNLTHIYLRLQQTQKALDISKLCHKAFPSLKNLQLLVQTMIYNGQGKEAMNLYKEHFSF